VSKLRALKLTILLCGFLLTSTKAGIATCASGCSNKSCPCDSPWCWKDCTPPEANKTCSCGHGSCPNTGSGDCRYCEKSKTPPCGKEPKKCTCMSGTHPGSCVVKHSSRAGTRWWPQGCQRACKKASSSAFKSTCPTSPDDCDCNCQGVHSKCGCSGSLPCAGQEGRGRVWCDCGYGGCKSRCSGGPLDGGGSGHWCGVCNGYPGGHLAQTFGCDGAVDATCCGGCGHTNYDKTAYGCKNSGDPPGQSGSCWAHCASKSNELCTTETMCGNCGTSAACGGSGCVRCDVLHWKSPGSPHPQCGTGTGYLTCADWRL